MASISRFDCVSSSLTLNDLLRKPRHVLSMCFGLGIVIHLSLMRIGGLEAEHEAVKPLTTQFIKRQPRLTKPLELKKCPRPKQQMMRRQMVSIKAKVNRHDISSDVRSVHLLRGLSQPNVRIERSVALDAEVYIPEVTAAAIGGSRDFDQRVDMSLEMLDIEALDTGRYHAMVVQDPTDKRNVTGFFHFVRAYSKTMRHINLPGYNECEERQVYALMRLARYISECTDIRTDVTGASMPLDSDDILKVPWIYLGTLWPFKLSVAESQHLGRYLLQGGFLFAETLYPLPGALVAPSYASFRSMFVEALAWEGIKGRAFERIPNSHPIYHCYFDFGNGPPMAGDAKWLKKNPIPPRLHPYLEGLSLEGDRMVGIISQKWYANAWGDWGPGGYAKALPDFDPERPLQFGVNLVIFALTQEGSITHRLMDSIR